MSEDENPFENVPDEFAGASEGNKNLPANDEPVVITRSPSRFRELPPLPPEMVNRGRYALASGFGFVLLIVIFYLGIVLDGDIRLYVFGIAGMTLSTLVGLFYMLDDLRIRPRKLSERGTKFLAGIFWALLLLLCLIMTAQFWAEYVRLAYLGAVIVLTNVSFSLFFYSMLWED